MVEDEVGEIYADRERRAHLADLGLRRWTHVGMLWVDDYTRQAKGIAAVARQRHLEVETFALDGADPLDARSEKIDVISDEAIKRWLVSAPKPLGLVCMDAGWADHINDLLRFAGIRIPEQVAIISADDNPVLCNAAWPQLSGVRLPWAQVGYEAARALSRMLDRRGSGRPRCLALLGVVTRQSTNLLAIGDERLAQALAFIRDNACRSCSVEEVLDHAGSSRSLMDRTFREALGRTVFGEIRRVQIERAQMLLSQSDRSMTEVAHLSGFSSAIRLSRYSDNRRGKARRNTGDSAATSEPSSTEYEKGPPSPGRCGPSCQPAVAGRSWPPVPRWPWPSLLWC